MKHITLVTLIAFACSAFASESSSFRRVNAKATDAREQAMGQLDFNCYLERRVEGLKLTHRDLRIQHIEYKGTPYTLSFEYDEDQFEVILKRELTTEFSQVFLYNTLNFRTADFRVEPFNPELADLKAINCFVGAAPYFAHYDNARSFVIHNHVQRTYYAHPGFERWYNSYARSYKNYPNLILSDGNSFSSEYTVTEKQMKAKLTTTADLVTGVLEDAVYKVAPSGNLHISFGSKFTGDVTLMGTAYNYCIYNVFFSLARALISSSRDSLTVTLPGYHVHYQQKGLSEAMNISKKTPFMDLATLMEKDPGTYRAVFQEHKKMLEAAFPQQIEVLEDLKDGTTSLPKLILKLKLPNP